MDDFEKLKEIQRLARRSVERDLKSEKKIDLISLIMESTKESRPTLVEELVVKGTAEGATEKEVLEEIDRLIERDVLFSPKEGFVQKRLS